MKRDLQYLAISVLVGIVAGLFLSSFVIETPLNPTKRVVTLTSTVTHTINPTPAATPCWMYWEGTGNRSANTRLNYTVLEASLKQYFGAQLFGVGFVDKWGNETVTYNHRWFVLLNYVSLTQDDDIKFVENLFPSSKNVTIAVVQFNTPVFRIDTLPPYYEIDCG